MCDPATVVVLAPAGQQLKQMASPRSIAFRIDLPDLDRNLDLTAMIVEKRTVRLFVTRQHSAWISEIAHHHGNGKAVVISPMLPDKGQICLRQRVQLSRCTQIAENGFWGASTALKLRKSRRICTQIADRVDGSGRQIERVSPGGVFEG
jgi:hypothetical protein